MTAVADRKTGCTDGEETHFHSSPRAFTLEFFLSRFRGKGGGKNDGGDKGSKGVIFPATRHHLRSTRWTLP